ncbi:MAG: hypothetical protein SPG10_18470 [Enterocloster clostridioformis]|nr:hypothetical protein [Enterocloster clostridioformis]
MCVVGLLLSPLGGIVLGGLGITFGQKARSSSKSNKGRAAVILGSIAMAAAIIGYNILK